MTERSDWKARVTLDRDAIGDDIAKLVGILKRQRVYCVVSASNHNEARKEAMEHLERYPGIPPKYVAGLQLSKMPT